MLEITLILSGTAIGIGIAYLIFKNKGKDLISPDMLSAYKEQVAEKEKQLDQKDLQVTDLSIKLATKEAELKNLAVRMQEHKDEVANLQTKFKIEFENLAQKIFDEREAKFKSSNKESLDTILNPLKEKIKSFEEKVEQTHKEGIRERSGLTEQIKLLAETNLQMQEDARNLTSAIKGDSKVQGDWGENLLQRILEKAGLQKGINFITQSSFRNEEGGQSRPDYIILLPDDRQLIVDSKVSLTHYAQYHEADTDEKKDKALKMHMVSMWNHVKSLRKANYENIKEIKSPDYVLMYVPIESAFTAVLKEKPNFFLEALDQNVVVVTGSTLLATMQTVSYIWKQDNLNKRTLDIAKLGGSLHDKIHGFVDNYIKLGNQIETAQKTYTSAGKQLHDGNGNMVKTAMKLKEMGAKVSPGKEFPTNLIEHVEED